MDTSDIWLALSKCANYLGSSLTGPIFTVFIGVWFYTRHYLSLLILYSCATEMRTVGLWELDWDKQHYKSGIAQTIALILLGTIQLLNCYWSFLILKIAYRFVFLKEAKDERSDE